MKLAIVISVAQYMGSIPDLPGCVNDDVAMMTLVSESKEFDSILHLSSEAKAASAKQRLVDFVSEHKEADIDEAFFYFTGHGDFTGEEFYYLFSDYDEARRNQTSLQNSELDTLLRALSPKLTVKLVDACFSGVQYIKDKSVLSEYLAKDQQQERLGNCYFLFSSHSDQRSFQDAELSHFTRAVVESVSSHPNNTIRYKDIADFVADSFAESAEQKPFFVVQADFTEHFCSISKAMREALLKASLHEIETKDVESETAALNTLHAIVARDAERYCTIPEAEARLSQLPDEFECQLPDGEIADLYNVTLTPQAKIAESLIRTVGGWLNQNDNDYLVSVVMVREVQYSSIGTPEFHHVPATITTKLNVPYRTIEINAAPRYANIPPIRGFMFPVVSKAELKVFYGFSDLRETGIDEYSLNMDPVWRSIECPLALDNLIQNLVAIIWRAFAAFALGIVRKQMGLEDNPELGGNEPAVEDA